MCVFKILFKGHVNTLMKHNRINNQTLEYNFQKLSTQISTWSFIFEKRKKYSK